MIDDMAESEEAAELRLNLEKRLVAPQQRAFEAFVDAEQPRRWWGAAWIHRLAPRVRCSRGSAVPDRHAAAGWRWTDTLERLDQWLAER